MRSIDHLVTSPVIMYRRCSLDSSFACCWVCDSVGILPCSVVVSDVRIICIAQLQLYVWDGVLGRWIVGVSCCRERIEVWLYVGVVYHSLSLLWILVVVGGMGRFSPS